MEEDVERPARVVKELLENAIDADNSRIDVEVSHRGSDLIQIVGKVLRQRRSTR